jgi:hypothetical protein
MRIEVDMLGGFGRIRRKLRRRTLTVVTCGWVMIFSPAFRIPTDYHNGLWFQFWLHVGMAATGLVVLLTAPIHRGTFRWIDKAWDDWADWPTIYRWRKPSKKPSRVRKREQSS